MTGPVKGIIQINCRGQMARKSKQGLGGLRTMKSRKEGGRDSRETFRRVKETMAYHLKMYRISAPLKVTKIATTA